MVCGFYFLSRGIFFPLVCDHLYIWWLVVPPRQFRVDCILWWRIGWRCAVSYDDVVVNFLSFHGGFSFLSKDLEFNGGFFLGVGAYAFRRLESHGILLPTRGGHCMRLRVHLMTCRALAAIRVKSYLMVTYWMTSRRVLWWYVVWWHRWTAPRAPGLLIECFNDFLVIHGCKVWSDGVVYSRV